MTSVIIDNVEFKVKDVVVPVSRLQGDRTHLLGFDASIFKNRTKDYDLTVSIKEEQILSFLQTKYTVEIIDVNSYYINDLKLYIDVRLNYKHNFNAYEFRNKFHIDCLNKLIQNNDVDIIQQWCLIDTKKRQQMVDENKKYLEIFEYVNNEDLANQIDRVVNGLYRRYTDEVLKRDLTNVKNGKAGYHIPPNHNKLITQFQPQIATNENIYWSNPINRRKHIENCVFLQYVKEYELTNDRILMNFRYNKYVQYYSYFPYSVSKQFTLDYKPQRVLDSFGGWGQRYLGFLDVDYIYNDLWTANYDGMLKIHNFCKTNTTISTDKKFYNEDAGTFPFNKVEIYDTYFSCPPYFNIEIYNNKRYDDYNEFLQLWDNSVKNTIHNKLKTFAFIIRNTFGNDLITVCNKYGLKLLTEHKIGRNIQHHMNRQKVSNDNKMEYLYVMTNQNFNS